MNLASNILGGVIGRSLALAAALTGSELTAASDVKLPPNGPSAVVIHPNPPPVKLSAQGGWIYIKLPRFQYEPVTASPNGIVLLRDPVSGNFARWKAGGILPLGPESIAARTDGIPDIGANQGIHTFRNYAMSSMGSIALSYVYSSPPPDNNFWTANSLGSVPTSGIWDEYIRVWSSGDDIAKIAQGYLYSGIIHVESDDLRIVSAKYARESKLVAINTDQNSGRDYISGLFSMTGYAFRTDYFYFKVLAKTAPYSAVGINDSYGAYYFLTALNSGGQAIGGTWFDGQIIAGLVEGRSVPFSPCFISENGIVLGRSGLNEIVENSYGAVTFPSLGVNRAAQVMYSNAAGYIPLPTDGSVTWVDELDRPNGFASDGRPVVWTPKKNESGVPTPALGYDREAYVPLPPPEGWGSNPAHMVPPNTIKHQLGVLRKDTQTQPFLAIRGGLWVDGNRNGVIDPDDSDLATAASPFRLWINDDNDYGDDKRSAADDIPLREGDSKRDSENSIVDGIRDLEDFFPVCLDIKQLLTVLPPGTNGISYYLKHEDSALGVVFTNYTRAQAFDYLRGSPSGLDTGFGPALTQKAGEATVVKITAAGVDISTAGEPTASPALFDRIKNNDGGVLLIEASKVTTKPLILEVRKGAAVIAVIALPLKIDPVETMFRYFNLRSFAHGTPVASHNQGPGYGSTIPTTAPNDPFAEAASRKNLVFVHGYNVNGEGARGSASTAFKRFYWSGSKARFYALLWRGDDGQGAGVAPAGATPDYHRNVGHAWQQGPLFRDFLGTLQGDTAIMAHSLGNGVTKVALTRARDPNNPARLILAAKPATVENYFAVDSALPLEATSASDITTESKSRMRHSWWAEYDGQERLWPTHWHELFAGSGDGREGLTWQNVFANLEVGTNLYSSGEEVLANPVNDGLPVWEPLFFAGLHAWIAQEKHKGGNGAAAPFFRSWTAGWVENKEWYQPIVPTPPSGSPQKRRRFASEAQNVAKPSGVPTSALAAEPFFQRFQSSESGGFYPGYHGSRLHAPVGDTNADDEARKLVTVAKVLGEAIPALSYPQGSNTATKFDDLSGNFDLNTSNFKNGWPTSRGGDTNWKHSDCLDVSYIYHFKFYDRMKTDGGLQ